MQLKNKPSCLLHISSKGTVPVLKLDDEHVLHESLDIMLWCLEQKDPAHWQPASSKQHILSLIESNDRHFKPLLDKYKYALPGAEPDASFYREQAKPYLQGLDHALQQQKYLISGHITLADMAIFPFIRQFAFVDRAWFDQAPYPNLRHWLDALLSSKIFQDVMIKTPFWTPGAFVTFPVGR